MNLQFYGTENMNGEAYPGHAEFSCLTHKYYIQKYFRAFKYCNIDNVSLFRCNLDPLSG